MPKTPLKDTDRRYMLLAVRIMGEFGASIALPVVVLAVLGKHLDTRFGTAPYLRVAGFAVAALMTAAIIRKRAYDFGKEYEAIGKEEDANAAAQKKEEKKGDMPQQH